MNVELSRRAGRAMRYVFATLPNDQFQAFRARIESTDAFTDLSKDDQDLIVKAEHAARPRPIPLKICPRSSKT